jgi:site-specific DNA-cytosine methylase
MLQNHELSAAQGFDRSYTFCGSKADVTRQIGNSVAPPVAAAITKSILGV